MKEFYRGYPQLRKSLMLKVSFRKADVDGFNIFYREAGSRDAPAILLLHGFPSASHMFRDLIPLLADRLHVIAPDLPGFGQSDMPDRGKFTYTFDNVARVIDRFTEIVGLGRFAIYVFDYGAPTGFRLATWHPERVTAIISQNGNAYAEGLSDGWKPIRAYWEDPSQANRDALRAFLAPETTVWQYTHGVPDATAVSPDGYSLDNFYLARPGADEVQLDLFGDYKTNVSLYPVSSGNSPLFRSKSTSASSTNSAKSAGMGSIWSSRRRGSRRATSTDSAIAGSLLPTISRRLGGRAAPIGRSGTCSARPPCACLIGGIFILASTSRTPRPH
jgi:pimeloyl-ACP methyl ester carboxylesterase